jgi:anti-sigma B factor antagonist
MSFTAGVRKHGNVTVIDLAGRLTLGEPTALLRDTLRSEAAKNPNLLLNLENVSYLDSAGLGEMVGCYTSVTSKGGTLKLLHIQRRLQDLLQVTRLLTVFEVFEDEGEAVRSFANAAQVPADQIVR